MATEMGLRRALGLTFTSWFLSMVVVALGATGGCGSQAPEDGGGGRSGAGGTVPGLGGYLTGDGGTGVAGTGGATGGIGGGSAGMGGVGGTAGGGGAPVCPPPASNFGCAPTYDQQLTFTLCLSSGQITAGRCGSGWAWHCASFYSQVCVYDADKNLVGARWCDDAPSSYMGCPEDTGPLDACIQSSGYGADGGLGCDAYDLTDGGV